MFEIVEVGEVVAGKAEEVRKEVEKLITSLNRSTLDIGELLYVIKSKGYFKNYGFNTFLEYVSELDIKTRKAQYLTRIVDIMHQVGVEREDFEKVGIAKLREITSLDVIDEQGDPAVYDDPNGETHLISDIIKGLIVKGQELSLAEIKDYVRVIKGFSGENEFVWLNISVNKQALIETIQPALDLSKKLLGTAKMEDGQAVDYGDGKALEMICVSYLNDPANTLGG